MERSGKENWKEEVVLRGRGRRQMKKRKGETETSLPEERDI